MCSACSLARLDATSASRLAGVSLRRRPHESGFMCVVVVFDSETSAHAERHADVVAERKRRDELQELSCT